ncbi:MAG: hypothetical protein LKJ88_07065 [Bacilli bacterium]|jgi:cytochrome bd-type quinol oxidase subunit 2|nr:hypothetical protein [Bacilli bacterium]
MENASKVMYKIANVFNWIIAVLGILVIVLSILGGTGVIQQTEQNNAGWNTLWLGIYLLVFAIVLIVLTRMAYKKNSGQGWDILFIVFGFFEGNIFYLLGGIFGLVAASERKQ